LKKNNRAALSIKSVVITIERYKNYCSEKSSSYIQKYFTMGIFGWSIF